MNPGNPEMTALIFPCHRANASALSGRTQVCVTMLTGLASQLMGGREVCEKPIGREW